MKTMEQQPSDHPSAARILTTKPTPMENQPSTTADKLLQAFQLFNTRAAQLQQTYRRLSKRLYRLNRCLVSENRRLTEERHQQVQVQRTRRIDALGDLAVKMAQELRNPLGSMELFASLLQQDLDQDAETAALVAHLLSGVRTLNHIISNTLLFTIRPTPRLAVVDPHPVLAASLVFAEHLVRHQHLRLLKDFSAEGATINADAELVKQVFLNLILNAIQAMPEGGTLMLMTRCQACTFEVQISDTGTGIAPEILEHIFNPFFTTKEQAVGLGLTLVHNIVEAHGGTLQVDSTLGRGTTMTLSFPLASATAERPQENSPASEQENSRTDLLTK
jgi:signal transduction histidine kinase